MTNSTEPGVVKSLAVPCATLLEWLQRVQKERVTGLHARSCSPFFWQTERGMGRLKDGAAFDLLLFKRFGVQGEQVTGKSVLDAISWVTRCKC